LTTEYAYEATSELRSLAERLADGKPYLIITREDPNKADISAQIRKKAREQFKTAGGLEDEKVEKYISGRIADLKKDKRLSRYPDSELRAVVEEQLLNTLFEKKAGQADSSTEYHYVFLSKTEILKNQSEGIATERGATIEGELGSSKELFSADDPNTHPFGRLIKDANVGLVILRGADDASAFHTMVPEGVPVLVLGANSKTPSISTITPRVEKLRQGINLSSAPDNIGLINMFPATAEAATAWGFSSSKAAQYASAGKRFQSTLGQKGYAKNTQRPDTKEQFLQNLQSAALNKKAVFVIAEADEKGAIRIPGSRDQITQADLAGLKNMDKVFFLSCNSTLVTSGASALAVSGKIYTRDAAKILEVTLPDTQAAILTKESKSLATSILLEVLAELACQLASDDGCRIGITTVLASGRN
jgi:hypothetical protein